jgi:hypothetical protein
MKLVDTFKGEERGKLRVLYGWEIQWEGGHVEIDLLGEWTKAIKFCETTSARGEGDPDLGAKRTD